MGIELLTIDARIVIASVDTYLRFAEATNRLDLYEHGGKDLPELFNAMEEGGAKTRPRARCPARWTRCPTRSAAATTTTMTTTRTSGSGRVRRAATAAGAAATGGPAARPRPAPTKFGASRMINDPNRRGGERLRCSAGRGRGRSMSEFDTGRARAAGGGDRRQRAPTTRSRADDLRTHDAIVVAAFVGQGVPILPMRFGSAVADATPCRARCSRPRPALSWPRSRSWPGGASTRCKVRYEQDGVLRRVVPATRHRGRPGRGRIRTAGRRQ